MADKTDSDGNAPVAKAPVAAAVEGPLPAIVKPAGPETVAAVPPQPTPVAQPAPISKRARVAKPVRKPASVSRKIPTPAKARSPRPLPDFAKNATVTDLKEKIMATKSTTSTADFTGVMTKSMSDAVAEMQAKAQEAYDKGTTMVSEMTDLAKGNVEAMVESGKIMAAAVQDLGKTYADEARSAYETMTADLKEMAAVKSPTELFQLQGRIMRRNFDMLVATSSKGSESAMKLANDVMAPISARVNLTVEKLSKAA